MRRSRASLIVLGCLFVLSGFSALVVEQVFEKWLLTVVGAATHSAALVVGGFFGGLSTGGLLYERLRRRVRQPLSLFVILELTVALSGLALASLFVPVQGASAAVVRLGGEGALGAFVSRASITLAWMAIPTVAMGATYPALLALAEDAERRERGPYPIVFYAANLLGAVGAATLAPYVLFPRYGLASTMRAAAAAQLLGALSLFVFARQSSSARTPDPTSERTADGPKLPREQRSLVALAAVSGFVFFTLEVVWYHLIGATIGMSAYAFATMLVLVLLSLFAGSVLVWMLPERTRGERLLPFVFVACALALSTTSAWDEAPLALYDDGYRLTSFAEGEWLRFRVAAARIVPTALVAGTVYPLLLRTTAFRAANQPRLASLLGASNAVGSLLGAWLTSFVLLDRLGAERTLTGLAVLLICLATGMWLRARSKSDRARSIDRVFAIVSVLGCIAQIVLSTPWDKLALTSGYHVYFRPHHVRRDSRLLYFRESGEGGFVTVVGQQIGDREYRTLLTNGKFQGNDGGEVAAQIAFAALPTLAAPGRTRALVIGYGTGQSAKVVADAGFSRVDVAELSGSIVEAARSQFAHIGGASVDRDDVALHLEDGRQHLLRTSATYDLVSMEITSIWFSGATNLYSETFYELVRSRLASDGVFQQWIQLHHLTEREILSVFETVRVVFPEVRLYYVGGQGIILASARPLPDAEGFARARRAVPPSLLADLRVVDQTADATLRDPWTALVLDATDLGGRALEGAVVNTDENHYLEFATPRYALSRTTTPDKLVRKLLELVPPEERAARAAALFPATAQERR